MITHLRVKDYQSIGTADIDLGQVTVLVGPRDTGKSALMRALNALITNETGSDFIRKGTDECAVTVTLDSGHVIKWTKTEKTAEYDIVWPDGLTTTYEKLAGAVPEDVQKLLNIRPIQVEKDFSIMPQVHQQFDQPLLLRESSGRIARALAKVTKLDSFTQAQVASAKNLRAQRAIIKTSTEAIETLDARIAEFTDIDTMRGIYAATAGDVSNMEEEVEGLNAVLNAYHEYVRALDATGIVLPRADALEGVAKGLTGLSAVAEAFSDYSDARAIYDEAAGQETEQAHECANLDQAIHHLLGELKVCPVCGQAMP